MDGRGGTSDEIYPLLTVLPWAGPTEERGWTGAVDKQGYHSWTLHQFRRYQDIHYVANLFNEI